MLNVRSDAFWKLTQLSRRMYNHCVKIHVVHGMFLSLFSRSAVWFGHETIVCQGQRSTHQCTDVSFPWVSHIEFLVFNTSFIGWFYLSGNECNWTNTKQLVFSKSCPQKGFIKTWKCVFQTFQFRLNFTGTNPQFAEIFRYYITEAQIIQNWGYRSTLNESFYSVPLFLVFTSPLYWKGKPYTQDDISNGYMFQVISSLLPLSNFFGTNSQKIAKNRFKSYNSTANFSRPCRPTWWYKLAQVEQVQAPSWYRACTMAQGKASIVGMWLVPWHKERSLLTSSNGTGLVFLLFVLSNMNFLVVGPLQHDSNLKKIFSQKCFSKNWLTLRKPKKNLRKEGWQRTSGTTKWHKFTQVGVRGTSGTRRSGSSDLCGTSGTRRRGSSDRLGTSATRTRCPVEPLHVFQSSLQDRGIFRFLKFEFFGSIIFAEITRSLRQVCHELFLTKDLNRDHLLQRWPKKEMRN